MKKKLTLTALLCGLALACVGAGCDELSKFEEKEKEGYKISVSYDANGGSFLNRPGVTVVDMFNPSKYEKDGNGTVHIKLLEPTDPSRPTSGDGITLTLQNHFFAGWYKNREVKTVDGKPVDEDTIATIFVFFFLYFAMLAAAAILVCRDGFSLTTSFTAALACLSNIGPGLDAVGPMGNFAAFSPLSKWCLSLTMLIGRLEIFPLLILFFPSTWKKT
jgi:hypothetical protein